ncbi:hypothetical protein Nmel_009026, partial [Mimus melanotis]
AEATAALSRKKDDGNTSICLSGVKGE